MVIFPDSSRPVRARRSNAGSSERDPVPEHQGSERVGLKARQRRGVAPEARHAARSCARQRAQEQLLQARQVDRPGMIVYNL